jgi:hypothetical protein
VTEAIRSRNARVRRSVEQASMPMTDPRPAMKPVLLMCHEPSGW